MCAGACSGNVDVATLNLYTQGLAAGLDFSDINAIARTVEHCNQLPIHPRHPYVGDLVFTAFSGSHQDAIKKGFAAQKGRALWAVPYLPIDPADLGRSYDSVIRINSQSGKGGVAWLMETAFGIVMPRRLQVEFSATVQRWTDAHGGEMTAEQLWALFDATWLNPPEAWIRYTGHRLVDVPGHGKKAAIQGIELEVEYAGRHLTLQGQGHSPLAAAIQALQSLGLALELRSHTEQGLKPADPVAGVGTTPAAPQVCALVEVACAGAPTERFGVGLGCDQVTASLRALVSGVRRLGLRPVAHAPDSRRVVSVA